MIGKINGPTCVGLPAQIFLKILLPECDGHPPQVIFENINGSNCNGPKILNGLIILGCWPKLFHIILARIE